MSSNAVKQRVPVTEKLIAKYGCGPVHFSGRDEALYERHLLFDNGVDVAAATARDRFEALARSVRDVLSQRWLLTEKTYEEKNPKRLYFLGVVFLIILLINKQTQHDSTTFRWNFSSVARSQTTL